MRCVVVVVLLTGCYFGVNEHQPPPPADAGSASSPNPTCEVPTDLCSYPHPCDHNNQRDDSCYVQLLPGHCTYVPGYMPEQCDGADVKSCTELGYYGGTTACNDCILDVSGCEICPINVSCTTVSGFVFTNDVAVGGAYIAFGGSASVEIFSSLTPIANSPIADVVGVAAVPGGWLVASSNPPSLSTLDVAGVRGPPRALVLASAPTMASAGGRVVIAWNQLIGTEWHVYFAIADASANIVVPETDLFATDGSTVAATTDGTSFFVGANGRLARIAQDGTRTITSGFPYPPQMWDGYVDLSWSGTSGWYVSRDPTTLDYVVQRFDSSGAMVGAPRVLHAGVDFLGDGDDLLGIGKDLILYRYTPTGETSQAVAYSPLTHVALAHFGSDTLVAWNADVLRVTVVP